MDDSNFIPDYVPYEDEIPEKSDRIRSSTSKPRKGRNCPSCPGIFTNVRRHVLRQHLPWYISPTTACWECKIQFGQESLLDGHITELHNSVSLGRKFLEEEKSSVWVELVNGFIDAIRHKLNCNSLEDLCQYANRHIEFRPNFEPIFQDKDKMFLSIFNA